MTKIFYNKDNMTSNNVEWHPDVPFWVKPKIVGEKIIEGVRYYIDEFMKEYDPVLFDKTWKCEKTEIKSAQHKGETIGQDLYFTL
jgi:hypothetical protein